MTDAKNNVVMIWLRIGNDFLMEVEISLVVPLL